MGRITDQAEKHQPPFCGRAFLRIFTLAALISGCTFNLQPAMLVDRIKNRGPVSLSVTNPYLVANQYLDYQRKNSIEVAQFLSTRGAPAALEIQKPLFGDTLFILYYPENGEYFMLTDVVDGWSIAGPYRLSARKMQQIREVVQGITIQ